MSKSIEKQKLFSASEIAAMHLPGLPKTIANIHARAKSEVWHYETKVGLGGVRKMYEIPAYYLPGYKPFPDEPVKTEPARSNAGAKVAGSIMNGAVVDSKQLALAIRALDEHLQENGLEIKEPEVKAEIVAILYKQLQKDASGEDIQELLRVMTRRG